MKLLEKGASDRPLSANHIIARLTEIEGCSTNNTHSFNATEPPQNGPVFPGKIRAIQSKWLWLLGGTLGGTLAVIAIFWCTHWLFNLYEKDNTASLNHQEQAPQPQNMTNKLKMRFVWIPPGSFMMGSMPDELGRLPDEAPHKVTLTKGFYMGVHLVTRGQFAAFVEETKFITEAERAGEAGVLTRDGWISGPGANWRNPSFEQTDDHPVTCVSWNDAFAFANWLFKEEGKPYRLPTEAEWEYACRAGTTTAFHFGDSISTDLANYRGRTYRQKTTPVGMFPANAFGLHDMHGNLWEWCHDWFVDYQEGCVIDPKGAGFGIERVHRGGAWMSEAAFCRAACRRGNKPDHKACDIGIRLCLSLK
jgi:formylglycine-generating enzyme required for sulfatase activity